MADTRFILGGVSATSATQIILPVMRGAVGIYMPTSNSTASTKNWLAGAGSASVVGAPTYSTGYVRSPDASNRISTGFAETAESTLYIVARSSAAFSSGTTRPHLGGIFRSQDTGFAGTSIRVTATPSAAPAATVTLSAARDASGVPELVNASITVADLSAWTLLCGRVKSGAVSDARMLNDLTNATSATASAATGRTLATTVAGTNIMSIGNSSSLSYGTCDVMYMALFDVPHTDAEMNLNGAAIKAAVLFDYGVTV